MSSWMVLLDTNAQQAHDLCGHEPSLLEIPAFWEDDRHLEGSWLNPIWTNSVFSLGRKDRDGVTWFRLNMTPLLWTIQVPDRVAESMR